MTSTRLQLTQPPEDIPAAQLFRLLSTRERPVWPIKYRIGCAPHVPLSVRALRGAEARSVDISARGTLARFGSLLVAALRTADGPAFASVDELGGLTEAELAALVSAVLKALAIVSPTYGAIDRTAWELRLEEGAREPGNIFTAATMAECCDLAVGLGGVARSRRPDRYYGKPVVKLTDAQLLAYRAGCEVIEQMRGDRG